MTDARSTPPDRASSEGSTAPLGVRTLVVACLAVVVAVRVTAGRPADGTFARVLGDPGAALAQAATGWTVAGTLGDATAQGLRDLPLAAFVWLGDRVGLPGGVLQAGWRALVLVLAVTGAVRLARAVVRRGGSSAADAESWAPWMAALVYACGPVLVATTVQSPSDGLVAAVLPWVAAPLVAGAEGWGGAARSAAWLGLAGVGSPPWAFGALVVGLVAALSLARRRRGQLVRWAVLAALACAWWTVAFVWEAGHATELTPLLDGTGLGEGLWLALGSPTWAFPVVCLAAMAPLVAAGAALVLRVADTVVVGGLLAASAAAVLAHLLGWGLPVAAPAAADGVPVPLAPVLAWVGVAGVVAWTPLAALLRRWWPATQPLGWTGREAVAVGVSVALGLTAVTGFVLAAREPATDADADTGLWAQVEQWSDSAPDGRVLVLPAVDEPAVDPAVRRALAGRPWVARNALPPSGATATSALDDTVRRLSRGLDGPGTAEALGRLGIGFVLLRNDLPAGLDLERPAALVRHALAAQGASRVAVFFPDPPASETTGVVTDFGVRAPSPSVEIWSVAGASGARWYDGPPIVAAGDPGLVGDLADAGLGQDTAVQLAPSDAPAAELLSDSARRRDVDQREALDPTGPTLTEDAEPEVVPPGAAGRPTAARRLTGVASVSASSSAADLGGSQRSSGADPVAAVDGNAFTAWESRTGTGPGQWWQVQFDGATDLTSASVQLVVNAFADRQVTRVRLEHDAGSTELDVPGTGVVSLAAAGSTSRLRVVATRFRGTDTGDSRFGIAELSVPELQVRDALVVSGPTAPAWLLASRPGSHASCVPAAPVDPSAAPGASGFACDRGLAVSGPDTGTIDRVLVVDEPTRVAGRVWLRAAETRTTAGLADRLADPSITVSGSTTAAQDLVTRPQAAADGDLATAWRPSPEEAWPVLTLAWDRPRRVTGLDLVVASGSPSSMPTRVSVRPAAVADGPAPPAVDVEVGPQGAVSFPPVRTDRLSVTFVGSSGLTSTDSVTGGVRRVPVAVAEVGVRGGPPVTYDADTRRTLPCGDGPEVTVAGRVVPTSLSVTPRELVDGSVLRARLCERPVLPAGEVDVSAEAWFDWTPLGVALGAEDGPLDEVDASDLQAAAPPSAVPAPDGLLESTDDGTLRPAGPGQDAGTVVLAVPSGKGWTARVGDAPLRPVTVDGWAQGWLVPAGVEEVVPAYSAAGALRTGVGVALAGWAVVLAVAVLGSRRPKRLRDHATVGRSTHA